MCLLFFLILKCIEVTASVDNAKRRLRNTSEVYAGVIFIGFINELNYHWKYRFVITKFNAQFIRPFEHPFSVLSAKNCFAKVAFLIYNFWETSSKMEDFSYTHPRPVLFFLFYLFIYLFKISWEAGQDEKLETWDYFISCKICMCLTWEQREETQPLKRWRTWA